MVRWMDGLAFLHTDEAPDGMAHLKFNAPPVAVEAVWKLIQWF